MVVVIGTPYCSKCRNIKRTFEYNDVDFKYIMLGDLDIDKQEEVKQKAKNVGQQQFPIILDEDELLINYREVMSKYGIN